MFDLPKFGRGVSLARVDALLDLCGIDRARLAQRSIVVTGSNGKGSACAFLSRIGMAAGFRVGTFTSPHLLRINERFRIGGSDISDAAMSALGAEITQKIALLEARFGAGSFGAFEAQFVAAALWFQRENADLCVFEAGIGGRLDATRLVRARVTILASVDLEHTALLGATRDLIALDKSDACAPGGGVVHGENLLPLADLLSTYESLHDVTPVFLGRDIQISDIVSGASKLTFSLDAPFGRFEALSTPLLGRFQASNAACAAVAFHAWMTEAKHAMDAMAFEASLRQGLSSTSWPGRLERISDDPLCVVDVGHSPDAISQALDGLFEGFGPERWLLVAGVSADKDAAGMLAILKRNFSTILCTQAHHKGRDARELADLLGSMDGKAEIFVESDIGRAAERAFEIARDRGLRIYTAGGLFVAVEFAQAARGEDPRALAFL